MTETKKKTETKKESKKTQTPVEEPKTPEAKKVEPAKIVDTPKVDIPPKVETKPKLKEDVASDLHFSVLEYPRIRKLTSQISQDLSDVLETGKLVYATHDELPTTGKMVLGLMIDRSKPASTKVAVMKVPRATHLPEKINKLGINKLRMITMKLAGKSSGLLAVVFYE